MAKPDSSSISGPWAKQRLADLEKTLDETVLPVNEVPLYRGWEDELRELRVAHRAEVDAVEQTATTQDPLLKRARFQSMQQVCHCKDYILRKAIPVDGDKVIYGSTYRFRLRVRDSLKWSFWTEFSAPVFITVPPPRPLMPQRNIHSPVPPPSVDVQLARGTGVALDSTNASSSDVRLQLKWERFEGQIHQVEYRVFMWTLSPEQRRRASSKRQGGNAGISNFETKGRCTLPPITGTQTVVLNPEAMTCSEAANVSAATHSATSPKATIHPGQESMMIVKPRAQAAEQATITEDLAVSPGVDGPQVIAHLRPYEPPPRVNTMRRTPKTAAATLGNADPTASVDKGLEARPPGVEVGVVALPKGHGYIFGVEAKHGKGVCGSVGEWSVPLFSKLIEFESVPRQLNVEVDARFGALLFKANAVTTAAPMDECIAMEAPAVNFIEEHRDLPRAVGLMPVPDPITKSIDGKYLVKSIGRSVYSERFEMDGGLSLDNLPERRPPGDDFRNEVVAKPA